MTDDQASQRIYDRIDDLAKHVDKINIHVEVLMNRVAVLEEVDRQSTKMMAMLIGTGAATIGATVAAIVSGLVVALL